MVSKHILLWRTCWGVRIDCSDFENGDKNVEHVTAFDFKNSLNSVNIRNKFCNLLLVLRGIDKKIIQILFRKPLYALALDLKDRWNIYRRERLANIKKFVPEPWCNQLVLRFSKLKRSIQTIRCDLYIKMCLETKFYIFLESFYYLLH